MLFSPIPPHCVGSSCYYAMPLGATTHSNCSSSYLVIRSSDQHFTGGREGGGGLKEYEVKFLCCEVLFTPSTMILGPSLDPVPTKHQKKRKHKGRLVLANIDGCSVGTGSTDGPNVLVEDVRR